MDKLLPVSYSKALDSKHLAIIKISFDCINFLCLGTKVPRCSAVLEATMCAWYVSP